MLAKQLISTLILTAAIASAAWGQARPFDTPDGQFEIELIEYQSLKPVPTPARLLKTDGIASEAATSTDAMAAKAKGSRERVHFTWGADIGTSIDLSGNDITTFDVDIALGLRRGWLNFIGVGCGANLAISTSQHCYPAFVLFRTNFTDRPTRCFWELKGGAAVTVFDDAQRCTGIYAGTGLGIKLAAGAKFRSHLVIGYTFVQRSRDVLEGIAYPNHADLHYATMKIGIAF